MEKNGLTYLSENELKEINGGMPLLVIGYLIASNCLRRVQEFIEGVEEGYARSTTNN